MKSRHKSWSVLAMVIIGCGGASSRPAPAPTNEGAAGPDVPGGSELLARVDAPLSSTYANLGETVRLRTESVLQSGGGEVLVPRNAAITGKVTERVGDKVFIDLDTLEMEGTQQPVKARIVGAEAGFKGELHAGDILKIRLDGPVYSLAAQKQRSAAPAR